MSSCRVRARAGAGAAAGVVFEREADEAAEAAASRRVGALDVVRGRKGRRLVAGYGDRTVGISNLRCPVGKFYAHAHMMGYSLSSQDPGRLILGCGSNLFHAIHKRHERVQLFFSSPVHRYARTE